MPKTTCSIEGCGKQAVARGWCPQHWARWRKHGDPLITLPHARARPRGTPAQEALIERDVQLRCKYGISLAEYEAMAEAQEGRCALCGTVPKRRKSTKHGHPWAPLVVDHDHGDGHVRGLLCLGCNIAMGRVEKIGLDGILAYLNHAGGLPAVEIPSAAAPVDSSVETICRAELA